MCIGIPMRVIDADPGHALAEGRGERRRIETVLVGACAPGDWLLVFLDSARERIDAARAAEVNATLDLLASAFSGGGQAQAGFALPSSMSAEMLATLAGTASSECPQETPLAFPPPEGVKELGSGPSFP